MSAADLPRLAADRSGRCLLLDIEEQNKLQKVTIGNTSHI